MIGLINLVVLLRIVGVFRRMRSGAFDEAELEEQLSKRGLSTASWAGPPRAVTRPGRIYPVGLGFGLGFDTATEVSLLVLVGGAAAFALPWSLEDTPA